VDRLFKRKNQREDFSPARMKGRSQMRLGRIAIEREDRMALNKYRALRILLISKTKDAPRQTSNNNKEENRNEKISLQKRASEFSNKKTKAGNN